MLIGNHLLFEGDPVFGPVARRHEPMDDDAEGISVGTGPGQQGQCHNGRQQEHLPAELTLRVGGDK